MYDKRIQWFYDSIDTVFSLSRIIFSSKFKRTKPIAKTYNKCLIMGNSSSLIESLKCNEESLASVDLIAVNFMGITAEYEKYKPNVYVLCDPALWFENVNEELKNKVINLYKTIVENTDWPLQLYIPHQAKKEKRINALLSPNMHIKICYYNKTKFEGYKWLKRLIYNKQWGIPRAQNVLIVTLMLAIYSNYKEIYLAGADNDWVKHLWVDEKNNLRLNDFHYYNDDKKNIERILPQKIHEQFLSFHHAFKSYTDVGNYAIYRNVKIYNTSLHSYIDAFEKKSTIQ